MTLTSLRSAAIGCALALVLSLPTASQAQTRELRYSMSQPSSHFMVREVLKPLAEDVAKKTGGTLKITVFADAALGGPRDQLQLVETGVADIATILPVYYGERFALSGIASLPFAFATSLQGSAMLNAVREEYLDKEYDTVKILAIGSTGPSVLATAREPVTRLSRIKGLNLRGSGGNQTAALNALGANVIPVGVTDVYVALQRGTIAGGAINLSTITDYKLDELVKHITHINFGATAYAIAINRRTWERLSDAHRAALQEMADAAWPAIAKGFDKEDAGVASTMEKKGIAFHHLPAEDEAELRKVGGTVQQGWVTRLEAAGKPARKLSDAFDAARAAAPTN